jgi:phosphonate transport system permease protein
VGGGGIGFYLSQRINVLEYQKAGTAIWAIVLVVWAMDFFSAEVRKRYT